MNPLMNTERPKEIKIATYILWAGLLFTFGYKNYESVSTNTLYGLVINGYLYTGIYKGRNSARILSLMMFLVTLAFQVPLLREVDSNLMVFVNFVQILSGLAAFYLLFTNPGKKWFSVQPVNQRASGVS